MNTLMLLMIVVVMLSGYAVESQFVPRELKLLPELFSALVLLLVVVHGIRNRFQFVRPGYWFAFGAIAATMLCGALANSLESGPVIAGMRNYLRAMPMFFLPAVFAFSERQIRSQLLLLLVLCLLQIPIAISQRIASSWYSNPSGDDVRGTLLVSGTLSIYLICAACVLTGYFIRRRASAWLFVPLLVLVLLPTAINETKATAVLLPIGLLVTFYVGSERRTKLKNMALATMLLALFGAMFVPLYDHFIVKREYGVPIGEFFTDEERLSRYMSRGVGVGAEKVGRTDAIVTSLREVSRDPTQFGFGLGIGNASNSALGEAFSGKYARRFAPFIQSSAVLLILEVGMLGFGLALLINWLVFRDSRAVAQSDQGFIGTLAIGWAGTSVVIVVSNLYVNLVTNEAISYLFWYFSGVVAAHRVRLFQQGARASASAFVSPSAKPARV